MADELLGHAEEPPDRAGIGDGAVNRGGPAAVAFDPGDGVGRRPGVRVVVDHHRGAIRAQPAREPDAKDRRISRAVPSGAGEDLRDRIRRPFAALVGGRFGAVTAGERSRYASLADVLSPAGSK